MRLTGYPQVIYRIDRVGGPSVSILGHRDVAVIKPQTEERARAVREALTVIYPNDRFRIVKTTNEVIG